MALITLIIKNLSSDPSGSELIYGSLNLIKFVQIMTIAQAADKLNCVLQATELLIK